MTSPVLRKHCVSFCVFAHRFTPLCPRGQLWNLVLRIRSFSIETQRNTQEVTQNSENSVNMTYETHETWDWSRGTTNMVS